MKHLPYEVKILSRWTNFNESLCGKSLCSKYISVLSKVVIKMNRTPRYWHSKNGKIAQKSHIIQRGGQTVRLTTKSHKKPNILQKISFPHSGLRFLIRPTVRPQFTKIGGSEKGPKIFFRIFLAFSQYLRTPKTISLKTFQNFLTLGESKSTCVLMGHPSKY